MTSTTPLETTTTNMEMKSTPLEKTTATTNVEMTTTPLEETTTTMAKATTTSAYEQSSVTQIDTRTTSLNTAPYVMSTGNKITQDKTTTSAVAQTTVAPYAQYNMTFLGIEHNVLVTPAFNFTLHNKPTLQLVNDSHTILILDCAKQQYVELPDQGIPCLEDLGNCHAGFTFKMQVQFTALDAAEKTYLLSSGGDVETASGMAIYIQSYQLTFGVKKGMFHWTGKYDLTGTVSINAWYAYEISWSETTGLLVLINGFQVIKETSMTPAPSIAHTNPVLIGKTAGNDYTACMHIKDLFTWTVHREVLVDQGILPGDIS